MHFRLLIRINYWSTTTLQIIYPLSARLGFGSRTWGKWHDFDAWLFCVLDWWLVEYFSFYAPTIPLEYLFKFWKEPSSKLISVLFQISFLVNLPPSNFNQNSQPKSNFNRRHICNCRCSFQKPWSKCEILGNTNIQQILCMQLKQFIFLIMYICKWALSQYLFK